MADTLRVPVTELNAHDAIAAIRALAGVTVDELTAIGVAEAQGANRKTVLDALESAHDAVMAAEDAAAAEARAAAAGAEAELAASAAEAPKSDPPLPFDPWQEDQPGVARQLRALVGPVPPRDEEVAHELVTVLERLKAREVAHPGYEGGRPGVIEALEHQIRLCRPVEQQADVRLAPKAVVEREPAGPFWDGLRATLEVGQAVIARIGGRLVPAEFVGTQTVARVKLLEGHPGEVTVEMADLLPPQA